MKNPENFDEQEMKDIVSRYQVKPVPESLIKDYLAEVRAKVEIEKSKGGGLGLAVWMGAVVFTYALALAFALGVYWQVGAGLRPAPTTALTEVATSARPAPFDVKIESDAELAAILSLLGEDENFLSEQDLSLEVERMDRWEIHEKGDRLLFS